MPYHETAPPAALRPWVECFWTRSSEDAPREVRVLPDGCADLVFDLSSGEAMAVGTMTRPLFIKSAGQSRFFGIRFLPGRAAAFLRIPLVEITDARVPLAEVWKDWRQREIDLTKIEEELLRRLVPDGDRRVDQAVQLIAASAGTARVEEIARVTGTTRQNLARQFVRHVGVSPKTFARVIRFRRTIEAVSFRRNVDWADVALEHGYYDQSHLIADFRDLSGATPSAFHFSNR